MQIVKNLSCNKIGHHILQQKETWNELIILGNEGAIWTGRNAISKQAALSIQH